jgi:hypothetical protein
MISDGIRCPKCGETKIRGDFYVHRGKKKGITCYCKPCHRENTNSLRRKKREKGLTVEERNKLRIVGKASCRRYREIVYNYYGNKCACCGETHKEFFAIDHINNDGNIHRRTISGNSIALWLIRNNFPSGFQILCHNCNMAKALYSICPHQREKGLKENERAN